MCVCVCVCVCVCWGVGGCGGGRDFDVEERAGMDLISASAIPYSARSDPWPSAAHRQRQYVATVAPFSRGSKCDSQNVEKH